MAGLSTPLRLVRHVALPQARGLCHGRLDLPAPIAATEAAARRLAVELPPWPLLSSPLRRCHGLATAIAEARGEAVPATDARLAEMHFGDWEGLAWDAVPRADLDAWAADPTGFRPPCGESFEDLIARVGACLRALERPHVLVTHGGVVRAAAALAGMAPRQAAAIAVPHATVIDPATFAG